MSNIQIVGDILQQNQISRYSDSDIRLLQSSNLGENFGGENDYIEYHILDSSSTLQSSDYNYKNYKLATSSVINPISGTLPVLEIDPLSDLQNTGYNSGQYQTQYNFFRNRLSDFNAELYIKEISPDRTELRLASNIITNDVITGSVLGMIEQINDLSYYQDFLLNFGSNQQYLVTNIILDTSTQDATVLVKLYQPLPPQFQPKDTLWIVEEIIDAYTFNINFDQFIIPDPAPQLRGPNFDIEIKDKNHKTTQYENYSTLLIEASSSQILNYLNDKGILLSIDYTDYNNFIHFSSVESRINNFYNKVKQIEDLQTFISSSNIISGSTPNIINDINNASSSINNILTKLDNYENYLYYQSSSQAYPKISSTKPYILQSTGSSQSISWYSNSLKSGSLYDSQNLDNLVNTIPDFIRDDENNQPYIVFVNMIGQYFDTIWIYINSITSLWNNSNNQNEGVSKDLVQYMLQSLGVNLYNNSSDDLSSYLVGANSGSNSINNTTDRELLEETYRRLYHNIPYLTKAKGTLPGLRALITCFGIPQNILDINEYGGTSKSGSFEISQISSNKIRVINNQISGSVLSPFIQIEDTPDDLLLEDLPYVDVSFNPDKPLNENIKTLLSGSFNIDDYIGDPGYELSSSYTSLNTFKKTYYGTYFSQFNYTKYENLVSYFDNSLFKMIQDFVPARANTSIGILIESPIFERNKIPRYNPQVDQNEVFDAIYPTASVVNDNSYLFSKISGSKKEFYNGELSGSYYNIHKQFEKQNINPYLNHTESFTLNQFNHSEFNILLNNVLISKRSKTRKLLEPLYSGSIVIGENIEQYAELQDTDLTLTSYQLSRYKGTKVFSQQYNNYTSSSFNYGGDQSFGKTSVIDYNVLKIGLLSQVTASQFLPKRNNITIKYLIDSSGSLTELNQRNKHWEEVQNTFKAGENLVISLFDNQKYDNQRSTEGIKPIFNSGYSYYPMLYFSSSDSTIYFDFEQVIKSGQFKAIVKSQPIDNTNYHYDTISGLFYDIFNDTSEIDGGYNDNGNYTLGAFIGGIATASFYTIPSTGEYSFQVNANYTAVTTAESKSLNTSLFLSSSADSSLNPYIVTSSFTSSIINSSVNSFIEPSVTPGASRRYIPIQTYNLPGPVDIYSGVTFLGTYTGSVVLEYTRAEDVNGGGFVVNAFTYNKLVSPSPSSMFGHSDFVDPPTSGQSVFSKTFDLNITTPPLTFTSGTMIQFSLTSDNFVDFTYQANSGFAQSSLQSGIPEIDGGDFITNITNTEVTLRPEFSSFLDNYIFIPISSSLYPKYGDIDYTFSPQPGDLLRLVDHNGVDYEIPINSITTDGGLNLISKSIPLGLATSSIDEFLLLKKVKDETNIIVTFIKKEGLTSLGLTIPQNLDKNVLSNIDTITSAVKPKLIDLGV